MSMTMIFPQPGQVRFHLQNLVHLFLVPGDDHDRVGVADDVFHLAGGIGRVDSHGYGSRGLNRQVGVKPFPAVVPQDGDILSSLQAASEISPRQKCFTWS